MWRRIKRVVESNLGRFRDDPLTPAAAKKEVASALHAVREQVALLERELARLEAEAESLGETIRAELAAGRRQAGLELAKRLGAVRDERAQVQKQLEISQRACARAEAFGQAFQAKFAAARSGGDPELEAAADATLARIERDLTVEGAPVSGKTLGAPSALPAGKTLGGVTDPIDAPTEARSVQKTIGPAAAPASDVGQAAGGDLVDELERLAQLRDAGALTDDEFDQAKRRLLGG